MAIFLKDKIIYICMYIYIYIYIYIFYTYFYNPGGTKKK